MFWPDIRPFMPDNLRNFWPITPSRPNIWAITASRRSRHHAVIFGQSRHHAQCFWNYAITPNIFQNLAITPNFLLQSRHHAQFSSQSRHHARFFDITPLRIFSSITPSRPFFCNHAFARSPGGPQPTHQLTHLRRTKITRTSSSIQLFTISPYILS